MSTITMRKGDDLEDDFVVDDLVALSEEEVSPELDDEFVAEEQDDAENEIPEGAGTASADALAAKKRKRREKEKERKAKRRKLAEATEPKPEGSLAAQPPSALADYLALIQKKCFTDMSDIEFDDIRIPESSIADTTSWSGSRTLDQLADFITKVLPRLRTRLGQKPKSTGSPTLLFITSAALRVADVARILKNKELRGEKGGEVAKLFAKHIKLSEHVTYLRRTKVAAAPGTPGRIGKLLEIEALSVSQLSHIILDITFRDAKNRNVLEIPETRDEIFKTVLGAPQVVAAIKAGKVQVVLF